MPHKNADTGSPNPEFSEALAELKEWFDGFIPLAGELLAAHRRAHALASDATRSTLYAPIGAFMDRLSTADGITGLQSAVSEALSLARDAVEGDGK